jgi:multiple sugar transport system ATP-binding protein
VAGVTFSGVTKRFGDVVAVDALDLEVADGELMVLLGPSGCGKSTALRMIAGLESVTEGTLRIGDRVVNDVVPAKRDVSLVFQSYALYPHMTVAKNIESPLLTRKVSASERKERIAEAARMLGLEPYLDRKPGALSGGQRQRVALARAVVSRPSVFLMDEPLSNLDAKLRTQTRGELVDLHQRLGTTFVYVTHDQVEAMTMATRIAVMSEGRLRQVGTPREVYETPADLFVAGFIGTPPMNTVPDPDDASTVLGVRPEHLQLDGSGRFAATAHQTEWLGHEALLRVRVDGAAVDWMVRLPSGADPPAAGTALRLGTDDAHLHRFDAASGVRRTA